MMGLEAMLLGVGHGHDLSIRGERPKGANKHCFKAFQMYIVTPWSHRLGVTWLGYLPTEGKIICTIGSRVVP